LSDKKSDWKIHLIALIFVIIAESIGIRSYRLGPGNVLLLPMLYALVMGMILGGVSQKYKLPIITREDMDKASPYIGLSVMFLIAKVGTTIGPNIARVVAAGPALLLQELGNFGTILFAVPVAVLVLKVGRETIGAAFSISRFLSSLCAGHGLWNRQRFYDGSGAGTYSRGLPRNGDRTDRFCRHQPDSD